MSKFLVVVLLAVVVCCVTGHDADGCLPQNATCVISTGEARGTITLYQQSPSLIQVYGSIRGLSPGEHGFHVHQYGDLSDGCTSAGEHYNPFNETHGAETDEIRHVGDMGNVLAGDDGVAPVYKEDRLIKLCGPLSVMGRALVVHAKRDDLGRGGNKESLINGNSGMRVGCCVIGYAPLTK